MGPVSQAVSQAPGWLDCGIAGTLICDARTKASSNLTGSLCLAGM